MDFSSAAVVSEFRNQAVDTFTQELRVASDFDGPVNFLLGGYYFNEKAKQNSGLDNGEDARAFFDLLAGGGTPGTLSFVESQLGIPVGATFAEGPSTREFFTLDNESYSVFGQVDFEVTDRLTLTAGFNYTDDRKDFSLRQDSFDPLANVNFVDAVIVGGIAQALQIPTSQVTPGVIQQFAAAQPAGFQQIAAIATTPCSAGSPPPACNQLLPLQALQFLPPFLAVPNAVEPGRTNDDNLSYTLRVAYDVSDRVNAYFTYATGFKASSVNLSRDSRPTNADYTPGPFGSTILAPSSPIRDAGIAVPNLSTVRASRLRRNRKFTKWASRPISTGWPSTWHCSIRPSTVSSRTPSPAQVSHWSTSDRSRFAASNSIRRSRRSIHSCSPSH